MLSASGGSRCWLLRASNAFTCQREHSVPDPLTMGSAPGPRWGLCSQTAVIGSCSALAMVPPNHWPLPPPMDVSIWLSTIITHDILNAINYYYWRPQDFFQGRGHRRRKGSVVGGHHGECRARAYNGGVGAEPLVSPPGSWKHFGHWISNGAGKFSLFPKNV